tara:strand:+ start:140 stop:718 length:579 start_codon:yes stop_codon:yes gene_type:complete
MKLRIINKTVVRSTNDVAINLIKKNNNKPTLIYSTIQTQGRGTMGKKWVSQKGNLFISIFFEFNPDKINFKKFAILNAYLLKSVLDNFSNKRFVIKWPNDLTIDKKKVCGILQEVIKYNSKTFLIIGIGVNTNISPVLLNFKSTSLKNIIKKKVNNKSLLICIKKEYEELINKIYKNDFKNKLKFKNELSYR